ncbi:MAG TPA: hypothetical protein VJN96_02580 [Vicinamibacterales bacterium]|nr:hypothetical protein [Vicinamibacterales bacterium]
MRRGTLIAGVVLVLVVITLGWLAIHRVVTRPAGNEPSGAQPAPGAPSSNTQAPASTAAIPLVLKGDAMARAFRSGKLPAPLAQPAGPPEQTAAELATRVMAEDEQSTAAWLTALQLSGFSVRGDDGSLAIESVKPGQGILIDAWEAAAIAKLLGDGMHIRLTDLGTAFARTMPPLKDAPVATLLLKGLRTAAQGTQPAMRFWADFIAELGRKAASPYDLLAPDVDPAKVELDAMQVSLILRRLAADLIIVKGGKGQPDPAGSLSEPASYEVAGGPFVQEGGDAKPPCTLKELESQILDTNAYVAGKGFDTILEYLNEHGMEGAGKFSGATSIANAVLAIVKLIAYYACMETEITMNGEPPLVRTQKQFENGEKRTLTATVRENIGKWQVVNCTRIALNGANLDISLPNDGPVAGVKTQWELTSGGYDVHHGQFSEPFVELVFPDGTSHVQTADVSITNASAPKTDEEGHTTIDIEGVKQKEKLRNPLPQMKQAQVRFTVAAKPVTMSQDLIDAVGVGALGGVTLAVGGPVEMLLRSNIYYSKALNIPVKDWLSCDGGWGGSITYTTNFHLVRNSHTTFTETFARDDTTTAVVDLRGNPEGGAAWSGASHGSYAGHYEHQELSIDTWAPAGDFGGATITAKETTTAVGGGEVSVDISAPGDNKYRIGGASISLPSVTLWHQACSGDCKGKLEPDRSTTSTFSAAFPAVTGQEDPSQPGVLHGSKTIENLPTIGATTTVEWNLRLCSGRRP